MLPKSNILTVTQILRKFGLVTIVVLLLVVLVVQATSSTRVKSPTIDEVIHFASEYYTNATKDLSPSAGHPPTLQRLIAAPLMFMDLAVPEHHEPFFEIGQYSELGIGKYAATFMLQNHEHVDQLVFRSRSMVVILAVLIVDISIW